MEILKLVTNIYDKWTKWIELAINNACQEIFLHSAVSLCFLQLMQSLYLKIQDKGLQRAYNKPDDRKVKEFTHKLAALVFVPMADVENAFTPLKREAPQEMDVYVKYFDFAYDSGVPT